MLEKLEYDKYKNLRDEYEKKVSRLSNVRMIMFIIMIISFILKYYYYKVLFSIVFAVSLVSFFLLVLIHNKYFKIYDYYLKYVNILDNYVARSNGEWKDFSDKGLDFLDQKAFLSDLDVLGNCSLFQYLSVCKTLGGREKLVSRLSNLELDDEELKQSQKLIKELAKDIDFCVEFQVMMNYYEKKKVHLSENLKTFLDKVDCGFDMVIGAFASIICILLLVLGVLNIVPTAYFYGMFFFNLGISQMYLYIYREDFIKLDEMVSYYSKVVPVLELLAGYKGTSTKMKAYVKNARNVLVNMSKLKELEGLSSLRNNLLSNLLFNGIFCLNLLIRVRYADFMSKHFKGLKIIISDIEELEAMISLATIGIVRSDVCMPEINSKIVLSFDSIKHPLISEEVCVSNSFDGKAGVNIITGSNMGGKTTFLRMIGINLILMQAGSYVCANSFSACYFKLFTSMRVMDNVDKGISTFYGELLRIKDMVEYNGKGNMLVLIDEIFKGTNYEDRMYGAREVVRKLNNKSTIAFITTHDFALCDSDGVKNFHVKEEYEGDRIIFDYKIREGKCVSTNAKYLMKKLDIVN